MNVKNILFKLVNGVLTPSNSTWGFKLPSLPNESTIGTDANGNIQRGSPKITISDTAPTSPEVNDLWIDTSAV